PITMPIVPNSTPPIAWLVRTMLTTRMTMPMSQPMRKGTIKSMAAGSLPHLWFRAGAQPSQCILARSDLAVEQVAQQRQAHQRPDDSRGQPGADAGRLGALVAPAVLAGVLAAKQIVAVLADLPRQRLTAVALRRAVVVQVDRRDFRLGRALQIRLAVHVGRLLGSEHRLRADLAIALA